MTEPIWPEWMKNGTWLWEAAPGDLLLTSKEPREYQGVLYMANMHGFFVRLEDLADIFDHDWQIPDEPDPMKRKWRKGE